MAGVSATASEQWLVMIVNERCCRALQSSQVLTQSSYPHRLSECKYGVSWNSNVAEHLYATTRSFVARALRRLRTISVCPRSLARCNAVKPYITTLVAQERSGESQ